MAQVNSIYEVTEWSTTTSYNKWDIVSYNNLYYYATQDHTSSAGSFSVDINAGKWDGVTTFNGVSKPKFLWQPVYNSVITNEPKVRTVKFGDGYEQRSREGINNNLISMDCVFEGKTLQEATSILHFLYARQGVESFVWTPPRPFGIAKLFVADSWQVDPVFYDNFRVTTTLREVVN